MTKPYIFCPHENARLFFWTTIWVSWTRHIHTAYTATVKKSHGIWPGQNFPVLWFIHSKHEAGADAMKVHLFSRLGISLLAFLLIERCDFHLDVGLKVVATDQRDVGGLIEDYLSRNIALLLVHQTEVL